MSTVAPLAELPPRPGLPDDAIEALSGAFPVTAAASGATGVG